ncbi:ureidoglycolate dehydrogenase [Paenibacillus mendelii]|uniref:Ureidoglycolate dehydrogenase n=1 Tax=Paenibacillus mendelii TaxID=206163 RepID=A0ABV6JF60_9BACL|nr:ureidoglycolate dehydrogenase [Paenibacillus mendelii]MCQ6557428.1 ureidoglycolate dehydrogenase [Paenibacillus mendelii]
MEDTVVDYQTLIDLCVRKFMERNVPADHARISANVLVHANLRGVDSHGIMRMEHYINKIAQGGIRSNPAISVEETGPVTAIVDGDDGLGHVVAYKAMEEAIRLAQDHGVGMVGAINSSHCGALSYFVQMAAEQNLIGIVMSNTDKAVVPFGGKAKFFGTNPMAFGFPTRKNPSIILDMATSTVAYGKVLDYRLRNEPIPPGWGVDGEGKPVTDPHLVESMLHFGGAKGFGLAMVVDIFSSILLGAAFGPHVNPMYGGNLAQPRKLGQYFCVVNPSYFTDLECFLDQIDQMIDNIHAAPPAEGFNRVLVPGEPELQQEAKRKLQGIPIPAECYAYLNG